jgi:hypothetical protein
LKILLTDMPYLKHRGSAIDFVAHTQQLVERKLKVGMMFYDLSKAFDTVNIEIPTFEKTRSNWNTCGRLKLVQKLPHRSYALYRCEW